MEFTKPEVAAVGQVVAQIEESVLELDLMELSLVGGGMGDVVFA
jgi:hypothetical protein